MPSTLQLIQNITYLARGRLDLSRGLCPGASTPPLFAGLTAMDDSWDERILALEVSRLSRAAKARISRAKQREAAEMASRTTSRASKGVPGPGQSQRLGRCQRTAPAAKQGSDPTQQQQKQQQQRRAATKIAAAAVQGQQPPCVTLSGAAKVTVASSLPVRGTRSAWSRRRAYSPWEQNALAWSL